MGKHDERIPSKADPRRGRNPGYAEDRPRDAREARQEGRNNNPAPTPDEPGLRRDPDPPATPGGRH